MNSVKFKVIFIGGWGRSGSTLLEMILGQVKGFFSVGELIFIWERGFNENQLCGCGKVFKECDFWGKVIEESFGSFQNVNSNEINELQEFITRNYNVLQVISSLRTNGFNEKLSRYSQVMVKLYNAIAKISGCKFIIDSSKRPTYGYILNAMPDIDLNIIHLIRDCRAVTYSYQRKKIRPEIHWRKDFMPVFKPMENIKLWNLKNTLMLVSKYFNKNYTLLRYEDLVGDPKNALSEILASFGEQMPADEFLAHSKINLGMNHTVAGNPIRFKRGTIDIQPDVEWQEKLDKRQRLLVNVLSWPLLLKYGYFKR
ncbi:MAG: sulfotransferase [Candidatus Anammoxibacter sp.]